MPDMPAYLRKLAMIRDKFPHVPWSETTGASASQSCPDCRQKGLYDLRPVVVFRNGSPVTVAQHGTRCKYCKREIRDGRSLRSLGLA